MIFDRSSIVLVVDDFEPMRNVTASLLRRLGIEHIVFASDGHEAWRTINKQKIDCVLSDWNMPIMTGLELLQHVRSSDQFWNMPFIMITAENERERIREAIENGVCDLLVKPYTPDRLQGSLEKAAIWKQKKLTRESVIPSKTLNNNSKQELELAQAPIKPKVVERACILIVDDTPENLQLLSQIFKDQYRVKIAHNGQKALNICQSATPPDLVLLDVMMPDMDGFEVARQMREHPDSQMIPIIFVTAMTNLDARLKGLELGAVDYVTKPIDPEQLAPRVQNFMRYMQLHKQLQADYDTMLEMERLKEEVAQMSRHDVKAPLAGVVGILQALQRDELLNNRQIAQLRTAENAAMQSINMINLTSELFNIESGNFKLNAKNIDIESLLRSIVELAREFFANKQLSIVLDSDMPMNEKFPPAFADDLLCYSIFNNLIKNACEAAPNKSRIMVFMRMQNPLLIEISNRGVIPVEIREHFFDKYVTQGKKSGTGIGTYSAKLLVEAQMGAISFSVSDEDQSTTLQVALPTKHAIQV